MKRLLALTTVITLTFVILSEAKDLRILTGEETVQRFLASLRMTEAWKSQRLIANG